MEDLLRFFMGLGLFIVWWVFLILSTIVLPILCIPSVNNKYVKVNDWFEKKAEEI